MPISAKTKLRVSAIDAATAEVTATLTRTAATSDATLDSWLTAVRVK